MALRYRELAMKDVPLREATLIRDETNQTITIKLGDVAQVVMSIGEWSYFMSRPKHIVPFGTITGRS